MFIEADEKASSDSKNRRSLDNGSESLASNIDNDDVYSLHEQRAIIHRVDRRLVITCGLVYCISLIDRGNLGNASIAGSVPTLWRYSHCILLIGADLVS